MVAWKIVNQWFSSEEYDLNEGPNTIGRGANNITTTHLSVSRNHCIIYVNNENVTIEDIGSSNGTFIDNVKIPVRIKTMLKEDQIIGIGSCKSSDIKIEDRFEFLLQKKGDQDHDTLKRKLSPVIIDLESDSESVIMVENVCNVAKKIKFENNVSVDEILPYEDSDVYEVKQEIYDEPISVDSDSESDLENDIWFLRLSQSSPGKPFLKSEPRVKVKTELPIKTEIEDGNDEFMDDIIQLPELDKNRIEIIEDNVDSPVITVTKRKTSTIEPVTNEISKSEIRVKEENVSTKEMIENSNTNIKLYTDKEESTSPNQISENNICNNAVVRLEKNDVIESIINKDNKPEKSTKEDLETKKLDQESKCEGTNKKAVIIDFLSIKSNKSSKNEEEPKYNKSKSRRKKEKEIIKCTLSTSQKEERKRKLKAIAESKNNKDRTNDLDSNQLVNINNSNANKQLSVAVKITSKNRGAFLTDTTANSTNIEKTEDDTHKDVESGDTKETSKEGLIENDEVEEHLKSKRKVRTARQRSDDKKPTSKDEKSLKEHKKNGANENNKHKNKSHKSKSKRRSRSKPRHDNHNSENTIVPLIQNLKIIKKVRFSTAPPEVRVFEIEPGNEMRQTRSIIDQQKLSPKAVTASQNFLRCILRWNPNWLDEQMVQQEPPPILGHNNPPMNLLHSYSSHRQYVQIVTDLLLFEVWDTLNNTYKYIYNKNQWLELTLNSAVESRQRFELVHLSVNIVVPKNEFKRVPRLAEIMFLEIGPRENKRRVFVFVQNVKPIHSNTNAPVCTYNLNLQVQSSKLTDMKPGEKLYAIRLSCIQNECTLFEAIDFLACSPLCEAILRPSPSSLPNFDDHIIHVPKTLHTQSLNPSQIKAVGVSLAAAIDHRPSIQMIQGPPGTGKSHVICSIIMSYFYDENGMFLKDRGKVLICATSNAAVDELVIRLLKIRQTLPQDRRFRMVRVGRLEAMHKRAREISSDNLAQRHENNKHDPNTSSLTAEIAHLEAKHNMWMSNLEVAKDDGRAAYCRSQLEEIRQKIARLRNPRRCNARGQLTGESLFEGESSIVEGAHIVATTLSSAANRRLARIKGRISFCIIDEAGQATEPQALVPLTLGVRRLLLIGDPQQLPAYTNSMSARTYGLSESLFARLAGIVPRAITLLDVQYRMQPAIADYPNRVFYGGAVMNCPARRPSLPLPQYRIMEVNATNGQKESFPNVPESWCVSRLAAAVAACVRPLRLSFAVITPYNSQAELIRTNIDTILQSEEKVEVCSVDSFQGQERDVIIVSVARLHGSGFAAVPARLNVLLTRARHCLLLCLNTKALEASLQWKTLIDDAKKRKMFRKLPDSLCLPGSSHDDILKHVLD